MESLGQSRRCRVRRTSKGEDPPVQVIRTREAEPGIETSRQKKEVRDAAESARNKSTQYCLNRSTCEGRGTRERDCASTSQDEVAKLIATRVERAKVRRVNLKEEKETKRARLQNARKDEKARMN
jgi:hypothetical protein